MTEVSGAPEPQSDEPVASGPATRSAALAWLLALIGLAFAAVWIWQAPALLQRLPVASELGAIALFYALLFGPLVLLALIFAKLTGTKAWRTGYSPAGWGPGGLAIGAGGIACAALFAWLNGGLGLGTGSVLNPVMLAAGMACIALQVGAEELLFRGWLQGLLTRLAGEWPAMLLGSVLFAALHLAAGPMDLLTFGNLCLAGLLFALLAWRSGGIVAPFAAHFGWNAFEDLGLGLSPNPGLGPFGALRDYDIAGAGLWGGGQDGLNASVGTTIALLALILPWAMPRPHDE